MFTGIITDLGTVVSAEDSDAGRHLVVASRYDVAGIAIGASICHAGVCLTVVETGTDTSNADIGTARHAVDVSPETLARSTAGTWRQGSVLNLERSLTLGDELGGHLVTGHVDGVAHILERRAEGDAVFFRLQAPGELARYIAEKGSVALDGTSLTVNAVDGDSFSIMLIPHSLEVTTWARAGEGDAVNLEVDLMARYAARLMDYDAGQGTRK